MKKAILIIVVLFGSLLALRFILSGNEDTWICENGTWVKHGNPDVPKPQEDCSVKVKVIEDSKERLNDMSVCVSQNGAQMNFDEAKQIAQEKCGQGSLKEEHFCNDTTGTWWIDFTPNEPKEGCNPACVINVETRETEINWRCTGLIQNN